jgi:hypothetical protein
VKRTGKPYEGKPQVRFDEKMLEIGYGRDNVTLSEETERNREDKHQPVATTPVSYSTIISAFNLEKGLTIQGTPYLFLDFGFSMKTEHENRDTSPIFSLTLIQ